jgi:radical SAM superfamily enzyme YgiQ (UPF0313 family)
MIRRVLFAFAVLAAAGPAGAVEEILRFQSDIVIGRDGTLTVTETIRVTAEGKQIRRGLYRTFPSPSGLATDGCATTASS